MFPLWKSFKKPLNKNANNNGGFTLVELMISIIIFTFMTALLVAKYGNFNNSILFSNLVYDMALTLRTAQTYGISVQGEGLDFSYPYGVSFCALSTGCPGPSVYGNFTNKEIILFADTNTNTDVNTNWKGAYDTNDIQVKKLSIKRGAKIIDLCIRDFGVASGFSCGISRLDVTFQRPNPNAVICFGLPTTGIGRKCSERTGTNAPGPITRIDVEAADGNKKSLIVSREGLISILDFIPN